MGGWGGEREAFFFLSLFPLKKPQVMYPVECLFCLKSLCNKRVKGVRDKPAVVFRFSLFHCVPADQLQTFFRAFIVVFTVSGFIA